MSGAIRLELKTEEGAHRIGVRSFLEAAQASAELLHELDQAVAEGKFEWFFTQLGIGSGIAVFAGEWTKTDEVLPPADEIERAEERIGERYVGGLAQLDHVAEWPADYSMEALQAAQRLAQVLGDGVTGIVASIAGRQAIATITERVIANVKDLIGESHVVLGSVEGIMETVSLARNQRVFRVRDAVDRKSVACTFSPAQFEDVRNALGRRVLVSGKLCYSKQGQLVAVRAVETIRVLEDRQLPSADELMGIAPDFADGLPAEIFINRMREQDG